MGELRQDFLDETIGSLESLQTEISGGNFSDDFTRRLFRRIHTVKGTAQTFGFKSLALCAHEIENLLQKINKNSVKPDRKTSLILKEGIGFLLQSCHNTENSVPQQFINKIKLLMPDSESGEGNDSLSGKIPKSLLSQLSAQETGALSAAIEGGKFFYLLEVFFDFLTFGEGFKEFRRILSETGEIIAVSSSPNADVAQEIGFRVFFAGSLPSDEVTRIINPFKSKIEFESESATKDYSNDLQGLLAGLIADCEKKAQILDKKILFEVSAETAGDARKNLSLINDLALHLLRNAIDHAIEFPEERVSAGKNPRGKIKISVLSNENETILQVEDDGRGIDAEKVFIQAKKRGTVPADKILTETEALNLIFTHGFSTSETVSEISGRGVGLDIVKDLVEKSGGKIELQSKIGHGTIFEIRLPNVSF